MLIQNSTQLIREFGSEPLSFPWSRCLLTHPKALPFPLWINFNTANPQKAILLLKEEEVELEKGSDGIESLIIVILVPRPYLIGYGKLDVEAHICSFDQCASKVCSLADVFKNFVDAFHIMGPTANLHAK